MVIDTDTLKPLHPLTEAGLIAYREYLASITDQIIFETEHPVINFFEQINEKTHLNISPLKRIYIRKMKEIKEKRV